MIDPVGADPRKIDVGRDPDGGGRLLRDGDLFQVFGGYGERLIQEDGIEPGLEDVHEDLPLVPDLAGVVLAELPDVEDDPGEVGVGVIADVGDLDPRVRGLPLKQADPRQGSERRAESSELHLSEHYTRDSARMRERNPMGIAFSGLGAFLKVA